MQKINYKKLLLKKNKDPISCLTAYSKPLAKIKRGRVLTVQKCINQWCKVKTEKFSGWIKNNKVWGKIN